MGAIASHKAQRLPIECVTDPKTGLAAYGVISLVIAYITMLALAIAENLSVEKFEAITNVTAIAGFVILWTAFWTSSRPRPAPRPVRGSARDGEQGRIAFDGPLGASFHNRFP